MYVGFAKQFFLAKMLILRKWVSKFDISTPETLESGYSEGYMFLALSFYTGVHRLSAHTYIVPSAKTIF